MTHLKASTNGVITFDTLATTLSQGNYALSSDSLADQSIACFWDEFTASAPTGSGDDIRYNVFGTAPNRQLWIKWYSFELGDPSMSFVYMAAVLEEGTDNIYIVDQYSTTSNITSMDATVGLQNSTSEFIQAGGGQVNIQGNGSSNTDNDYYEFIYLDSLDAKLVDITSPSGALCPGTYNVEIDVQNTGVTTIDCGVGIQTLLGQEYRVYPNPTRDRVMIEFNESISDLQIDVYDALGSLVIQRSINGSNRAEVDLSSLAKGYYMLKLSSASDQSLTRIVLQ